MLLKQGECVSAWRFWLHAQQFTTWHQICWLHFLHSFLESGRKWRPVIHFYSHTGTFRSVALLRTMSLGRQHTIGLSHIRQTRLRRKSSWQTYDITNGSVIFRCPCEPWWLKWTCISNDPKTETAKWHSAITLFIINICIFTAVCQSIRHQKSLLTSPWLFCTQIRLYVKIDDRRASQKWSQYNWIAPLVADCNKSHESGLLHVSRLDIEQILKKQQNKSFPKMVNVISVTQM